VSYELRIERVIDAPPEVVFDTLVDPGAQQELFADQVPGWSLLEFEIDLRVGGTSTIVFGPSDGTGEADRLTYLFTEIDRPRRLVYDVSMFVADWGRTVDFAETITFEERDGKTLLTIVQSGFESEADRDAFMGGTPDFIDALERVVASRMESRQGRGIE
jgi:uncharacterized protein YndB with AHSA1/START domain